MKLADLNERVARAESRISELREQIATAERERVDESAVIAPLDGFDELWSALSPREQARVLALLVSRIEFDAAESIAVTSMVRWRR